jgi:hypothetical protein
VRAPIARVSTSIWLKARTVAPVRPFVGRVVRAVAAALVAYGAAQLAARRSIRY